MPTAANKAAPSPARTKAPETKLATKPTPAKAAKEAPPKPVFDLGEYLSKELSKIAPTDSSTSTKMRVKIPGVVPSLIATVDAALGRGGWPMARLCIVTGPEGGCKTTTALLACKSVQQMGGIAIYLDQEHKLDVEYAATIGVDMDHLLLSQPFGLENCFPIMEGAVNMVHEKSPDLPLLIVLDSMNAARTVAEFEEENPLKASQPGAQAAVMSKKLPRLMKTIAGKKVVLMFISQPRTGIGSGASWTELVACGKAPKFYASTIVSLERDGFLKRSDVDVGSKIKAKVIKNQVAPPFKVGKFNYVWGQGVDFNEAILQRGIQLGMLNCSQGWYECPYPFDNPVGEPLKWQGAQGMKSVLREHPKLIEELVAIDRQTYELPP